jgi:hypothetical protein
MAIIPSVQINVHASGVLDIASSIQAGTRLDPVLPFPYNPVSVVLRALVNEKSLRGHENETIDMETCRGGKR